MQSSNVVQLREMIRQIERRLGILDERELSCCGVSMAQCHALVEIGRAGQISLNELAELLNLDNSTMSRTVNNLVVRELACRDIDPQDRRYITISLTEAGASMHRSIEKGMTIYYGNILNGIPAEKQEQVLESLQLLLESFKKNLCCEKEGR